MSRQCRPSGPHSESWVKGTHTMLLQLPGYSGLGWLFSFGPRPANSLPFCLPGVGYCHLEETGAELSGMERHHCPHCLPQSSCRPRSR